MKKLFALLTALAMLMAAAGTLAETAPDLYDLYRRTEDGREWAGNAVPILNGIVVASPVGLQDTADSLEVWDGSAYRNISLILSVLDGKLLVLLYETDGQTPAIPEFDVADSSATLETETLRVRSGDRLQSRINRAVLDAAMITWQERNCMLLTLSGDTVPGAPLITADGKVAGIVVAEYAEGGNRYVALASDEIIGGIVEASELLSQTEGDTRPEGYTVSLEGNTATFSWADVQLPETAEGESLYHVMADTENAYLTYMEILPGTTEVKALLTPGRMYVSGLVVSAGTPSMLPEEFALTAVPEAEPLTDYNFRSVTIAIAEMPADADADAMPVPAETVTEELLRSGTACFYSLSTYEMTSESQVEETLLVTLTAPDGSNYRWESGWYYDPTLTEGDEWYVTLTQTRLTEMLDANGYPEGVYELNMYIGGKLADSVSFELVK